MKKYIEIQRKNVTIGQFLSYVKARCKEKGIDFCLDKDTFINPESRYNTSYYIKDNKKIAIDFESPRAEYRQVATMDEDYPAERETFRQLPCNYQCYTLLKDGTCFNEICEFQYVDDRVGFGYYYRIEVDAME